MTDYQAPQRAPQPTPSVSLAPPQSATPGHVPQQPSWALPAHSGPLASPRQGPPKDIATLPPLQVLRNESPPSPRTGEPTRPIFALLALVIGCLAAAAVAGAYAHHWWLAAHPASYPTSARLIEWVKPDPGKWLALTLEGILAAVTTLVAGACGVAGFQAWNGWRWSRWAGVVAVALTGAFTALVSNWGFIAVGLGALAAVMGFLPQMSKFFRDFAAHRAGRPEPYRRPDRIFYGRLPRYR